MKFGYIIATYAGVDHTNNKELASHVLDYQMKALFTLFQRKKDEHIPNHITDIIVVCPPCDKQYDGYYKFDEWRGELERFPVNFHKLDYIGENKHHSYDQYLQAYLSFPDLDYYILIEDDYCLDTRNVTVDIDLYNCFTTKFPDNIGYLATRASDEYHGYHASISNGLISRETFEIIPNILDTFYSITGSKYPQVNFSNLFISHGIQILDYSSNFSIVFWNSYEEEIEDYSVCPEGSHHIFLPVQIAMHVCK